MDTEGKTSCEWPQKSWIENVQGHLTYGGGDGIDGEAQKCKGDNWCPDSSMVRFLRIDPMVSGSSPTSAKLSLRVRRVASSL